MKRLLLILLGALLASPVFAQNTLTVHQKNGEKFSIGFEDKPVVKFTDSLLVVTTSKTELRYEIVKIAKFTFDGVESTVNGIESDARKASVTLDEYTVSISGVEDDTEIRLVSPDGKLLQSYKSDADGQVTFSIAQLPQGTYLITSDSLTCKIIKK